MKRIILSLALAIAATAGLAAQLPATLSDSARFYLITCEPGEISYQRFGHSGIEVVDGRMDIMFNWGIFSFEAPNFIGRFVLGHTDYMLGVYDTDLFLAEYRTRGSAVFRHRLHIDTAEQRTLWQKLVENYRPENRVYRYNFIYDNCATRVYRILTASLSNHSCPLAEAGAGTYRHFVNSYATPDTWLSLGINLVFGSEADDAITAEQSTTFPREAMDLLSATDVRRTMPSVTDSAAVDTLLVPLIGEQEVLFNADRMYDSGAYSRLAEAGICALPLLLLVLIIVLYLRLGSHRTKWLVEIVLWASVLISVIILFLWLCSTHPLVRDNYNLLWCNPLNAVLAVVLLLHGRYTAKRIMAWLCFGCSVAYFLVVVFGLQGVTLPLVCYFVLVIMTQLLVVNTYTWRAGIRRRHHHHSRMKNSKALPDA